MSTDTQNKILTAVAIIYLIGFLIEICAIIYIAVFLFDIQNFLYAL
jgi:hypothetical protein|tara:strand:+ start:871 stop:1008 length:138 start_codon:yes stop_codon:yes gene_type:complete